jgi:Kef-type K+ transport system membrane component KefB
MLKHICDFQAPDFTIAMITGMRSIGIASTPSSRHPSIPIEIVPLIFLLTPFFFFRSGLILARILNK